ncbi:hypothetical protein [Gracilimonas tropica]|uniref:hypothetical protein n=1 Tax=Gracilimonas tropica TaxID=454600 RepID=UPI0003729212|nr:hypothetical protein [Gracilimonas tropica]
MWYKNIKAQNGLTLILFGIGIFCSLYFVHLTPELTQQEKHLIQAEVFSELFLYLDAHPDVDADYFFVGVSGSDPAPEVVRSFNGQAPKVAPISSSMMSFGFSAAIVHKSNLNKSGIITDIKTMQRKENGRVNVITRIYYDRASFANYEFILAKKDGAFRVVEVKYPDEKPNAEEVRP